MFKVRRHYIARYANHGTVPFAIPLRNNLMVIHEPTRRLKKCCLVFSCCGGAVDSINWAFTLLQRSGFTLEFQTLYKSIRLVVAYLWLRKGKISGCFKNSSTSIVLQQCLNQVILNQVIFQRNGSGVVLKFLSNF